jgi:hypothetical protein
VPRENEPEPSEDSEDNKQMRSELSAKAEEPNVSQKMNKQAVSLKQGQQVSVPMQLDDGILTVWYSVPCSHKLLKRQQ